MMQVLPENKVTIVLINDTQSNDIEVFSSILDKCYEESRKAGFRNMFSPEERSFIEDIHELFGLKKDDTRTHSESLHGSMLHTNRLI